MNYVRNALTWLREKKLGRDVLVFIGILAVASGAAEVFQPGVDRLAFGGLVLYVSLWHGPVVARLVRRSEKE